MFLTVTWSDRQIDTTRIELAENTRDKVSFQQEIKKVNGMESQTQALLSRAFALLVPDFLPVSERRPHLQAPLHELFSYPI